MSRDPEMAGPILVRGDRTRQWVSRLPGPVRGSRLGFLDALFDREVPLTDALQLTVAVVGCTLLPRVDQYRTIQCSLELKPHGMEQCENTLDNLLDHCSNHCA